MLMSHKVLITWMLITVSTAFRNIYKQCHIKGTILHDWKGFLDNVHQPFIIDRENFIASPDGMATIIRVISLAAKGEAKRKLEHSLRKCNDGVELYFKIWKQIMHYEIDIQMVHKIFIISNVTVNPRFEYEIGESVGMESQVLAMNNPINSRKTIQLWYKTFIGYPSNVIEDVELIDNSIIMLSFVIVGCDFLLSTPITTTKKYFYVEEDKYAITTMVTTTSYLFSGKLKGIDADFIELPYKNNVNKNSGPERMISLFIILPNKYCTANELQKLMAKIDFENLTGEKKLTKLWLPQFRSKTVVDVKSSLKKMNILDMYKNTVILSEMIGQDIQMNITAILQKILIEITEARLKETINYDTGANTLHENQTIKNFHVDKPFIFLIIQKDNMMPLVYGHVVKPIEEKQQKPSTEKTKTNPTENFNAPAKRTNNGSSNCCKNFSLLISSLLFLIISIIFKF